LVSHLPPAAEVEVDRICELLSEIGAGVGTYDLDSFVATGHRRVIAAGLAGMLIIFDIDGTLARTSDVGASLSAERRRELPKSQRCTSAMTRSVTVRC